MNLSWRAALAFAALFGGMAITGNATDVAYCTLAVYALRSPPSAVRSMTLAVVVKFLNPTLFKFSALSGGLFWLVLLVGTLRLIAAIKSRDLNCLLFIWIFTSIAALLSIIASPAITISLMKLLAFILIVSGLLSATNDFSYDDHTSLIRWLNSLAVVVAIISALTLLRPQAAFLDPSLDTGRGLRGIFNHPQTLGIFLAPFLARDTTRLLINRDPGRVLQVVITVVMWSVLFLTQARTAAIAATVAILSSSTLHILRGRRLSDQVSPMRVVSLLGTGAAILVVAIVSTGAVSKAVEGFLLKREGANNLSGAFYASRGAGIEIQWNNFLAKPITGNGFGVYANGQFPDGVIEFAGIPISAPVEKGFIPTTLLEETGIPGFALFAVVCVQMLTLALRNRDLSWLAMLITAFMVNIGEAVILSPSGVGLLVWLLIGLGINAPRVADRPSNSVATIRDPNSTFRFANLMR